MPTTFLLYCLPIQQAFLLLSYQELTYSPVLVLLQTKAMSILRLLLILNFVGLSYPISEGLCWIMSKFARPEVGEAKLPVYS